MSNKANQNVSKSTSSSISSMSNSTAAATAPPTFKQLYATLRFCLRYANGTANIFNRLMKILETTDLITITSMLPEEELERFVPMIAQRLTRIRLDISDIERLNSLCQVGGVTALPLVRRCDLVPSKIRWSDDLKSGCLMLLGQLLPRLDHLNMEAAITRPFPNNLRPLHTLIVHQSVFQELLDRICENCPQLKQLYTRNETHSVTPLDVAHIVKCEHLCDLQLPLMLQTPVAVCHLKNLKYLTLQRLQLWPDMDWLASIREIINAKRDALQRMCFDGTWLATPLDLSSLQLHRCWALRDLLLSNCKLADPTGQSSLPLSCQRFGLMNCSLSRPLFYLKGSALMHLLELYKCQITTRGGKLLMQILSQRQRLPTLYPLLLRFSASTPLRSEFINWGKSGRQLWQEWLLIQELHEHEMTWKQQLGTITMTFGQPLNYIPDLNELNELTNPNPAELVMDL